MTDYRVLIPEERYSLVDFRQEDLPGVMVVNEALVTFEPKIVFEWHLSIMIQLDDLILNGMPSQAERDVIDPWGDLLDDIIKGANPDKPNALFLARITWNATRELIYRVFDPEPANEFLMSAIDTKFYPRNFDFRMEEDPQWNLARWHLNAGSNDA